MRILVYTTGATREIGGGRRVTSELLHHFNGLDHEAVSWSVLPLDPDQLHNGRYQYRAEYPPDPDQRPGLGAHFMQTVQELRPDFVLFDTEYSLMEFTAWSEGLLAPDDLPLRGALVHDQIWKWDPAILPLNSPAPDAQAVMEACPFPGLCSHAVAARRLFRRTLERDLPPESLLNALADLDPHPLELLPSTPERVDQCLRMKQAINGLDRVFCLAPRTVTETRAAYNLARENVFCAAGGECSPTGQDTEDVRTCFGLGPERGILCFSRTSREKNLELALGAFALARRENPAALRGVRLWIAGQCLPDLLPYLEELKTVVRLLGLEREVRFLGEVTEAQARGLFAQADAFVCAQTADFNLTTMQALGAGLPVVLFNGYDFPPGLTDCPTILASGRTTADMARDLVRALEERPSLAPRHCQAIEAMNFENYARTVADAFQDGERRANPDLGEPADPAQRTVQPKEHAHARA